MTSLPSQQKENREKVYAILHQEMPFEEMTFEQRIAFHQHEDRLLLLLEDVNTITASTWLAATQAERARVRALVEATFKEMAELTVDGASKYWKAKVLGYRKDDATAPLDKFFPQDVLDKLLAALDSESSGVGDNLLA